MYDDFYGLTGRPFQLEPDPVFYFHSATHRKALSYVGYGLAQGEGFIVITGEVGSGKSALVAHLMGTIDPQQLTAAQVSTGRLDEEGITPVVAQGFGLDVEGLDKAGALRPIENFLHGEARAGRPCLLIVDEAQDLSLEALEELRMLSNFQLGGRPLLQTLLLGRPEFGATLLSHPALEQLRQRVIAQRRLEPMERAEVEPYIVHRLDRAGWSGNPQFDQRVFAELHEASAGIPRRINRIASRLLLLGAVGGRTRIDAVLLKAVLEELAAEGAIPAPPPGAEPTPVAPAEPLPPRPDERLPDRAAFASALAERDAEIAELQQAIVELAGQQDATGAVSVLSEIDALGARVAQLEAKIGEQESAIRQTLAMLIDWIEGETEQSRAA